MTTIKEIAEYTHVSAATVSNVLNGKGGASDAKTREIREVAEKLHYTPNLLAKRLKKQRSNTIGIITEDLTVFNTPEIVDGVDASCEENGFEIILGNMRLYKRYHNDFTDTQKHQKLLDSMIENMLSHQVEAIVYVGYHCRELIYLPSHITVPIVYAYCYPKDCKYPSVIYDDEKAAEDITGLMIKRGHKHIGAICGPLDSFHTLERLKGYQTALFQNNILCDPKLLQYGDWTRSSGYAAAEQLIQNGVTGIFAFNDEMASGVYEYCANHDIKIGKDISLVGFDNREIGEDYTPKLTTVSLPLEGIGKKCTQLLISSLNKDEVQTPKVTRLPCTILERESIGDCPQK